MSFPFNNSIISKRRLGTTESPFVSLSEAHTIENSVVQLSEIPSEFNKVTVTGQSVTWLEQTSGIPSENTYVVDYVGNLVTFHSSREGLQLQFDFKGTGLHYIPAGMVYTQLDGNNNVIQTIESLADTTNEARINAENVNSTISTNETGRVVAEGVRISNENTRKSQEISRTGAETSRSSVESARVVSETGRVNAETIRVNNEIARPKYVYLTQAQYNAIPVGNLDANTFYEITDDDGIFPEELQNLIDESITAISNYNSALGLSASNAGLEIVAARKGKVNLVTKINEMDASLASYKAETATVPTGTLYLPKVVSNNADITSQLLAWSNGYACIDLAGLTVRISGLVSMNKDIEIKNGTIIFSGTGKLKFTWSGTIFHCKIHDLKIKTENCTSNYVIEVIRARFDIYECRFDTPGVGGILVWCEERNILFINIYHLDMHCSKCIRIFSNGAFYAMTDLLIHDLRLFFTVSGLELTRGEDYATNVNNRQQLSHANVNNIVFLDYHTDANDGVALYYNCSWSNFNNLTFFYDGAHTKPLYAIKTDPIVANTFIPDAIQGLRTNSFSNIVVEGHITEDAYHLNKFENAQLVRFISDYPLSYDTTALAKTSQVTGYVDTVTKSITTLDATTPYMLVGTYAGVTFSRVGKDIVIVNANSTDVYVQLWVQLTNDIKIEMSYVNRNYLMCMALIEGTSGTEIASDFQQRIIEGSIATGLTGTSHKGYSSTGNIVTTKGTIAVTCYPVDATVKTAISSSVNTIGLGLRLLVKSNSTIKVKDIKMYPYITNALNDDTRDWQNVYLR